MTVLSVGVSGMNWRNKITKSERELRIIMVLYEHEKTTQFTFMTFKELLDTTKINRTSLNQYLKALTKNKLLMTKSGIFQLSPILRNEIEAKGKTNYFLSQYLKQGNNITRKQRKQLDFEEALEFA